MSSQTFTQENYMGIIKLTRHSLPVPADLAGAQTPVNAINEITIFQAKYDRDTRKVLPVEAIATWWLSDFQWGEAVAYQNTDNGIPATLRQLKGHRIKNIEMESKSKREKSLLRAIDESICPDEQISDFFIQAKSILAEAREKGRLGKRDAESVVKYLNLAAANANSNMEYALECLYEIIKRRVVETQSDIHSTISNWNNMSSVKQSALPAASSDAPVAEGFNCINISTVHGSTDLFNDSGLSNRFIEITFSTARDYGRNGNKFSAEQMICRVQMSPEQFIRLIRANDQEIPCTLNFVNQNRCDQVKSADTIRMPEVDFIHENKRFTVETDKDILDSAKGKKLIETLEDCVEAAKSDYYKWVDSQSEIINRKIDMIFEQAHKDIERHLDAEIKKIENPGQALMFRKSIEKRLSSPIKGN